MTIGVRMKRPGEQYSIYKNHDPASSTPAPDKNAKPDSSTPNQPNSNPPN